MKSNINRHTVALKKIAGFSLAVMMGLTSFLSNADARLIFTTEDEGVNADAYHLDNDDSSSDYIDLAFGTGLGSRLRYDILNDKFLLNKDLNLEGNELQDFRIENATADLACATADDKGRMYYNTTNNDLLFCNGTTWISTSAIPASDLDGLGLVTNSGKLDVNVDNATLELDGDVVQVKDGGINNAQLADNAVNSAKILDGSVNTADLANDAVNADKIATNAVGTDEIANGSVKTEDIDLANFSIGTNQIDDNSLTADDLATGSVTTDEILDGTVATVDLADNAVNSAKILDGSVATNDIAAGANDTFLTTNSSGNVVWELKSNFMSSDLADGQMWIGNASGKATAVSLSGDATISNTGVLTIADNAVNADKIATNAVGTDEIANGSVKTEDIDLANFSIGTNQIDDNSLTADDLATGSVTTDEILDGTVATVDLADDAVNSAKILDNSIEKEDLKATGAGNNKVLTTDDSGNMVWADANKDVTVNISPEFPNFTLQADGSANKGTLESDHDDAVNKNYYKWSTRKTSAQDYDIVFQWMVPDNFKEWASSNPITVDYKTNTTNVADNKLDITMKDTAGSNVSLTGSATNLVSTSANSWVENSVVASSMSGTFNPGEYVTIKIKMTSKATNTTTQNPVYLGAFKFSYVTE